MLVNVRAQIEGRFTKVPLWYEPVCRSPPMPAIRYRNKPLDLPMPDFSLRAEILARHPELDTPVRMHTHAAEYTPMLDRWVTRQLALVERGVQADAAAEQMEREYADFRYRRAVERLITLEEQQRERGLTRDVELPDSSDNSFEQLVDRVNKVDDTLERRAQLAKYEDLRIMLEERLDSDQTALASERDLSELNYAERLEFVKLNPQLRRFFDEHLEVIDMMGIDVNHPKLAGASLDDEPRMQKALLEYLDKVRDVRTYACALTRAAGVTGASCRVPGHRHQRECKVHVQRDLQRAFRRVDAVPV
jgi:hypothetical protein